MVSSSAKALESLITCLKLTENAKTSVDDHVVGSDTKQQKIHELCKFKLICLDTNLPPKRKINRFESFRIRMQ